MGWRFKLVFLLIIYFSGFATAIYYLAPNGRSNCQAASYSGSSDNKPVVSDKSQSNASALFEKYYDKAAASFGEMDKEQFKAAFNRGVDKLKEMAKNAQSPATAEGAEVK